jgi:hypothetical protein
MKASSRCVLAPWRRDCTAKRMQGARVRATTPLPDDGDLFPLALWNACATSSIFNAAEDIMCNQGSPLWTRGRVEEEDEANRSAGEESSLWTPGKQASSSFISMGREKRATMSAYPSRLSPHHHGCMSILSVVA